MKSPFHVKKYDSYDSYVEQQCSKLNRKLANPHGKIWLEQHEKSYYKILKAIIDSINIKSAYDFSGKSCLCVGARGEAEVQAFIDVGCLAIGIDLNPTPSNRYVVTGDVIRMQYAENSFDIVYTNALDHFLLINKALHSISKVLKPNGMFLLVTGTPDGAEDDEFGSTYWDSQNALEEYMLEKHKLKTIAKVSIEKDTSGWFSHVVVLSNKKETA